MKKESPTTKPLQQAKNTIGSKIDAESPIVKQVKKQQPEKIAALLRDMLTNR